MLQKKESPEDLVGNLDNEFRKSTTKTSLEFESHERLAKFLIQNAGFSTRCLSRIKMIF